jgi:acetamidase/formamidase
MNTDCHRAAPLRALIAAALLAVATLDVQAAGVALPKADHWVRLTPENSVIGNFPAQKKPILTVKSGATVRIDGGGGNRWGDEEPFAWLKANGVSVNAEEAEAIREIDAVVKKTERYADIKTGHLLVGPIAIEGAEPGDTIEVRVLKVTPRIPYGTVSQRPGRGGIPDDVKEPHTVVVGFDGKRKSGHFDAGIEVPLAPFQGVMGLLPADSEGPNRRSGPPGLFGGNLDCKELVDGTSLYLPVFHPGGLFFTGDSHAAQGDGEVTVNAIETANTSVLQFILHKGRTLAAPRAESATHFMAFGLDPDLDNAMQMAIRETNTLLGDTYGLDFAHAFALSSIAIDFRVTQVVDETKGIHSMIPKALFTQAKLPGFWAAGKGR